MSVTLPQSTRCCHSRVVCTARGARDHTRVPCLITQREAGMQQRLSRSTRSWRCHSSSRDVAQLLARGEEVSLAQLQQRLEQAIDDEEYEVAAQLRDALQQRRADSRLAVEEANERFYQAFRTGNLSAMSQVWGKGEHVQCMHPLSGCIAGRQEVMESWKVILSSGGGMCIRLKDVRVFASDNTGFVTCLEMTENDDRKGCIAATNVFEKHGGEWKIVHHHGGPVPPGAV